MNIVDQWSCHYEKKIIFFVETGSYVYNDQCEHISRGTQLQVIQLKTWTSNIALASLLRVSWLWMTK